MATECEAYRCVAFASSDLHKNISSPSDTRIAMSLYKKQTQTAKAYHNIIPLKTPNTTKSSVRQRGCEKQQKRNEIIDCVFVVSFDIYVGSKSSCVITPYRYVHAVYVFVLDVKCKKLLCTYVRTCVISSTC